MIVYKFRRNLRGLISLLIFIVGNLSNEKKIRNAITSKINIWAKRENKIHKGNLRMSSTRYRAWHDLFCGSGKRIATREE